MPQPIVLVICQKPTYTTYLYLLFLLSNSVTLSLHRNCCYPGSVRLLVVRNLIASVPIDIIERFENIRIVTKDDLHTVDFGLVCHTCDR